jgi:hypothetical protein
MKIVTTLEKLFPVIAGAAGFWFLMKYVARWMAELWIWLFR